MSIIKNHLPLRHTKYYYMFSKACEYGMKASIYIAVQSQLDKKASLVDVADAIKSPAAYTSKILQLLSRNNIITSNKGPTGGFSMTTFQLETVNLSDIVAIIDGDSIFNGCGLGLIKCNENKPCPMHNQFKSIRDELKSMLERTSVKSLADDLEKGLTFLKR